ncbi:hypothetical protein KCU81_g7201, partial [Aureobasidium melanogenum]|uniref:Uncharacterized protein n=1 Tax=Aureobasidium melanogenum (strain CBS 110374) TaxID=1043003 RepID=A0A074W7Z2_AURM1
MAVVRWGIDDPENPRNRDNPELANQLEEERINFKGTAIKGAIRTNPDGIIMRSRSGEENVENEPELRDQAGAERSISEANAHVNTIAEQEDEHEHENHSAVEDDVGSLSPYSYVSYSSVSSTDERVLPPGWLRGIMSDGSRIWYTAARFSGPIINETPTQVPDDYVFNEHTQRWEPFYEL